MITYEEIESNALHTVAQHAGIYEEAALKNTRKVMAAFRKNKVSDYYLKPTTGYAYGDVGRDRLDLVYTDIFKSEAALVRSQFVSGTHALAVALLGVLKGRDEMICVTGTPYDTMQTIIGYPVSSPGSLTDLGVIYTEIPMTAGGVDLKLVKAKIKPETKLVLIQRSCGYSDTRKTLKISEIEAVCNAVKAKNPECICFVDNCYGEFIEDKEPLEVGADLIAGSLIKNLGGGLAPTGGYIAGKKELVELASYRLTAPGLGAEMGATLGDTARLFYQGLFLAPHVALQAVKTSIFAASVFSQLGYEVKPLPHEVRSDIIQAIRLDSRERLCAFCEAVQANSPVDAHVVPVPSPLPGYHDEIIMAAGTFVQGSSIELSADGPLRPPYNVFLQGGLTFEHGRIAIMSAAEMVGTRL